MNYGQTNETPVQRAELTRALLIYVPGQHTQYHRPYSSTLTPEDVNQCLEDTMGGEVITERSLANVASRVLTPQHTPAGQAMIANGFETPRFAVFLEITYKGVFDTRREILTGFTDYAGIHEPTGALDSNMRIFINSRQRLGVTNQNGSSHIVLDTDSFLPKFDANYGFGTEHVALRPIDLAKTNMVSSYASDEPKFQTINTLSQLSRKPLAASRQSNIPAHYLSKVLSAYRHTGEEDHDGLANLGSRLYYKRLAANLNETSIESNEYYRALSLNDPANSNNFTFGQLTARWQRPREFFRVVMPGPKKRLYSPLEHTEHWRGATVETAIAFTLTHAVPTLMLQHMVWEMDLSITNHTPTGQVVVQFNNVQSMFEGVLDRRRVAALERTLIEDVAKAIMLNRCNSFHVTMQVSIIDGFKMDIGLNGTLSPVPYSAPLFCDSLFSPMIGVGHESLTRLADGLETLASYLIPNAEFDSYSNTSDSAFDNIPTPSSPPQPQPQGDFMSSIPDLGGSAFNNIPKF